MQDGTFFLTPGHQVLDKITGRARVLDSQIIWEQIALTTRPEGLHKALCILSPSIPEISQQRMCLSPRCKEQETEDVSTAAGRW